MYLNRDTVKSNRVVRGQCNPVFEIMWPVSVAEEEHVSMNQFFVTAIAEKVSTLRAFWARYPDAETIDAA